MVRCAIYDRVSTDIQVSEGLSLEAQQEALIAYAKAHKYKIVDVYTDEGITARKKIQNRKELMRLLDDVKQDKIDLILVTKLDRWFRNIKDYHNTQTILEEHHCNWKTIFEEYDTSTANGRFAINIMLSVNENECDRDSDRIKEVFKYKIARGEWLGGRPPFGYMTDENKKLIKNPAVEYIVNDLFKQYFLYSSKRRAVQTILDKYPGLVPAGSDLQKMISKEIYTGYRNGIQICEPYISVDQFNTIKATTSSRINEKTGNIYFLSGLIECPYCHQSLTAQSAKKKKPNGKVYYMRVYWCHSKYLKNHRRPCKSEAVLERQLLDCLETQLSNFENEILNERPKGITDRSKIESELSRLNNMFQKGRITEDYYDTQYSKLIDKLDELPQDDFNEDQLLQIKQTLSGNWKELYLRLDDLHKKAFWHSILDRIYISETDHNICGLKFKLSR